MHVSKCMCIVCKCMCIRLYVYPCIHGSGSNAIGVHLDYSQKLDTTYLVSINGSIIWNVLVFLCYYLEGFHFVFPCHTVMRRFMGVCVHVHRCMYGQVHRSINLHVYVTQN